MRERRFPKPSAATIRIPAQKAVAGEAQRPEKECPGFARKASKFGPLSAKTPRKWPKNHPPGRNQAPGRPSRPSSAARGTTRRTGGSAWSRCSTESARPSGCQSQARCGVGCFAARCAEQTSLYLDYHSADPCDQSAAGIERDKGADIARRWRIRPCRGSHHLNGV